MENTSYIQRSNQIGLFLAILFTLCFTWYYVFPVDQELHLRLFRMAYVGFAEMNFVGFILGALQTYVWAYIFVAAWGLTKSLSDKNSR